MKRDLKTLPANYTHFDKSTTKRPPHPTLEPEEKDTSISISNLKSQKRSHRFACPSSDEGIVVVRQRKHMDYKERDDDTYVEARRERRKIPIKLIEVL